MDPTTFYDSQPPSRAAFRSAECSPSKAPRRRLRKTWSPCPLGLRHRPWRQTARSLASSWRSAEAAPPSSAKTRGSCTESRSARSSFWFSRRVTSCDRGRPRCTCHAINDQIWNFPVVVVNCITKAILMWQKPLFFLEIYSFQNISSLKMGHTCYNGSDRRRDSSRF